MDSKRKNAKALLINVLAFLNCTQKTICFRTALWKTWDESIVSESTFHHSMMSDFENFPHLGKGEVLMFFVISHPPYLPIIVEVACGKRLYKYHQRGRHDSLTPVQNDNFLKKFHLFTINLSILFTFSILLGIYMM